MIVRRAAAICKSDHKLMSPAMAPSQPADHRNCKAAHTSGVIYAFRESCRRSIYRLRDTPTRLGSRSERRLLNEGPSAGTPERRSAQRRDIPRSHNKLLFYFMIAAGLVMMLELGDRGPTALWRNVASTGRPSQPDLHTPSSATSPAVLLHPR